MSHKYKFLAGTGAIYIISVWSAIAMTRVITPIIEGSLNIGYAVRTFGGTRRRPVRSTGLLSI